MDVKPLVGAFGIEVTDCDLAASSDAELKAFLAQLNDAGLVVCRNQSLDPAGLSALAARLGERDAYPFATPLGDDPYVIGVIKEAEDESNFGGMWHTDTSYLEQPPSFTLFDQIGERHSLSDYRGKVVLLDWWGIW